MTSETEFYIPSLGDMFELLDDWTFAIHKERRNQRLIKLLRPGAMDKHYLKYNPLEFTMITLPKGTKLKIARIYIRAGLKSFDSITLTAKNISNKIRSARFWVKLSEINGVRIKWI